jgi:hypothetical protein
MSKYIFTFVSFVKGNTIEFGEILDLNSWINKFGEILGLNNFLNLAIFVGKKMEKIMQIQGKM